MKTLDEVIAELEDEEVFADALHYLKAYRSDQLEWEANRKAWNLVEEDLISARMKYIAKLKELEIGTLNNPLTWEELKGMEGKPVWVETKYYSSRWAVITDVDDVRISFVGKQLLDSEIVQEIGKTWQAYRKERTE